VAVLVRPATLLWGNYYQCGVKRALADLSKRITWNGEDFDCDFSHSQKFDDTALRRVLQATDGRIHSLNLTKTSITDEGVRCLDGLCKLQSLDLSCTKITDQGIACLHDLPQLECLYLVRTKVRGTTLSALQNLPKLGFLVLSYSKVDDSGLAEVAKLRQLKALQLNGLSVSMKGLRQLASIQQLEYIDLYDTAITEEEAQEIEQLCQTTVNIGVLLGKGGLITREEGIKKLREMTQELIDSGVIEVPPD